MDQYKAKVLENRRVSSTCLQLGLSCPPSWADAVPGQFVMIRLPAAGASTPFLPRPFSIYRVTAEGRVDILYRVVGRATRAMADLRPEDAVNLLGPLGNGFSPGRSIKRAFLVAGGIGVPPIAFLAQRMADMAGPQARCTVFLGGATVADILCREDFSALRMDVRTATEDGSTGAKGLVTGILAPAFDENEAPDAVFACGPLGMLQAVGRMAAARNVKCQVSIETMMACGMGACMGCAVRSADAGTVYKHACTDGPVFDFDAINLSERIF